MQAAFKDKVHPESGVRGETRILDLWMDMPTTNPMMQGGFLNQNFVKLDKDFQVMSKASKAQDLFIQTMSVMDQRQLSK